MPTVFTPLTEKEQALVAVHLSSDPAALALKLHGKKDLDAPKIIGQIVARQKAKRKLPFWYSTPGLTFPSPLSVEQASSEATARYKASLAKGDILADLTIGMGVDAFYFSKQFKKVYGYEQNAELAAITAHNLSVLGASNIEVLNVKGEHIVQLKPDCIYIDPSRRDHVRRKTVAFGDCSPNILEILPVLTRITSRIIVKSSPLIDLQLAVSQLEYVTEIHVIGYQKECKEIVFILDPTQTNPSTSIAAVVIRDDGGLSHHLSFSRQEEHNSKAVYGEPGCYLYEPHPAFLKAGAFNLIAQKFEVTKIAPNSHLYSSDKLRTDFPGRLFEVKAVVNASGFSPREWLKEGKANLTLRNFPGNPDDLRKKWRLKEGGHIYLFATTLFSGKRVVIVTEKAEA